MKKMYNNPQTETVKLNGEAIICLGVTSSTAPEGVEGSAPTRGSIVLD